MINKPTYLTAEGAEALRKELEHLKEVKRQELSARLRVAIQQGDLKENADYIATKVEQGFVEGRILDLEALLHDAIIIEEPSGKTNEVVLGSRVTIQEEAFAPETYHLVGANEANPSKGRISNESPIGRALLGKAKGELVKVDTPGGTIVFNILNIE